MVIVNSPCVFRVTDLGGHLTGLSATQGRYTVLGACLRAVLKSVHANHDANCVKERACQPCFKCDVNVEHT